MSDIETEVLRMNITPQSHPNLGVNLKEFNDLEVMRSLVCELYGIIDDIDTASDIAKDNEPLYRNLVHKAQVKRHNIIKTDGYELFIS